MPLRLPSRIALENKDVITFVNLLFYCIRLFFGDYYYYWSNTALESGVIVLILFNCTFDST